jgi:hypothetical protein
MSNVWCIIFKTHWNVIRTNRMHYLLSVYLMINHYMFRAGYCSSSGGKGKAIPLQAWTGREGSRRLRLPDFKTINI